MELDVVVVAYNSRAQLRAAVSPLVELRDVNVIVVDNDSPDRSVEAVADLPISAIRNPANLGFAKACNLGWRSGRAPYVLFLNPDAQIDRTSLVRMQLTLSDHTVGLVAPRTVDVHGSLVHSQRCFVGTASLWAQTFFLHRLLPSTQRVDGIVRNRDCYERVGSPDWVSGACMLVKRSVLEATGGFDERFFMYCEDMDLCRRIRDMGLDIRYEPGATAVHDEGSSAPSSAMVSVLARSRVAYVDKHLRGSARVVARLAIASHALSRAVISRGGLAARRGHLRALRIAVFPRGG